MYVRMYIRDIETIQICMCIYVYMYTYVHAYIYVYIYIHIYIIAYTHSSFGGDLFSPRSFMGIRVLGFLWLQAGGWPVLGRSITGTMLLGWDVGQMCVCIYIYTNTNSCVHVINILYVYM